MTAAYRTWVDLDHAKAEGYEAYFEGQTPSDSCPHGDLDGLVRDWWLSGWREARSDDQGAHAPNPRGGPDG